MKNSIQYFAEKSIKNFEKIGNNFLENPKQMAEFITQAKNEALDFTRVFIEEMLEELDKILRESDERKKRWIIESSSKKHLITSVGDIYFSKTLFTSKEDGHSEYLLDRILGMEKHTRMTEDAVANILEESVQTSYRRGGENVSITETAVSKETVKNKLHDLEFPPEKESKRKKEVEYLYIDADEDHVSLQFHEQRGDLTVNKNNRKNNCLNAKLVYVYEGIEKEAPHSKRNKLINVQYFVSTGEAEENSAFWERIRKYLDTHYDLGKVKKIYLNSDGGAWIMAGKKQIAGMVHVLDEFHLEKYLTKLTSHMKDSSDDAKRELRRLIKEGTEEEFSEKVKELKEYLPDETGISRMDVAEKYILANWSAAKTRLLREDGVKGSSTEGHVSHVLSQRMSSRPMGWSVLGASKMSQLLAYHLNGGDMLELVRYQKIEQPLPMAAGAENEILSCNEVMKSERNRHGQLGKYVDAITCSVSDNTKIKAYLMRQIWGL